MTGPIENILGQFGSVCSDCRVYRGADSGSAHDSELFMQNIVVRLRQRAIPCANRPNRFDISSLKQVVGILLPSRLQAFSNVGITTRHPARMTSRQINLSTECFGCKDISKTAHFRAASGQDVVALSRCLIFDEDKCNVVAIPPLLHRTLQRHLAPVRVGQFL